MLEAQELSQQLHHIIELKFRLVVRLLHFFLPCLAPFRPDLSVCCLSLSTNASSVCRPGATHLSVDCFRFQMRNSFFSLLVPCPFHLFSLPCLSSLILSQASSIKSRANGRWIFASICPTARCFQVSLAHSRPNHNAHAIPRHLGISHLCFEPSPSPPPSPSPISLSPSLTPLHHPSPSPSLPRCVLRRRRCVPVSRH